MFKPTDMMLFGFSVGGYFGHELGSGDFYKEDFYIDRSGDMAIYFLYQFSLSPRMDLVLCFGARSIQIGYKHKTDNNDAEFQADSDYLSLQFQYTFGPEIK